MQQLSPDLHTVPDLRDLPPDIGGHSREPAVLQALSDEALVRGVAAAIERPKRTRRGSFIIHAPLELLARARLLALAPPAARSPIRLRIAAIAAEYAEGEEVGASMARFATTEAAGEALLEALREGAPDLADAAIRHLIDALPVEDLVRRLADAVVGQLGLAAHAPILLSALPGAELRWGGMGRLLRAPIYALVRDARLRLTWIDGAPSESAGPGEPSPGLFQILASPTPVQSPSVFIAPTLLAVEAGGHAARTLSRATAGLSIADCRQTLLRIAALAMLQETPRHAPYGWTHCLSMPQGVVGLAPYSTRPERLVRVAATHALGFRATLGQVVLDPGEIRRPAPPIDLGAMIAYAGAHPDAHLAKYTLACLDAGQQDPEARGLYLAAAAYLADFWRENPNASFDS